MRSLFQAAALIVAASLTGCAHYEPLTDAELCPPPLQCVEIELAKPHTYDAAAIAQWEYEQALRTATRRVEQRIDAEQRAREVRRRVESGK